MLERLLRPIDRVLTWVVVALLVAMVSSISCEILLREVVQAFFLKTSGSSPDWLQQLSAPLNTASQTLLVWVGLLGSSLAYRHRAHLGVDAIVRLYPARVRKALEAVSTVLVAIFSLGVLLVGGGMVCARSVNYDFRMPGLEEFNRAWFYAVLPLSGALTLLYAINFLLHPGRAAADSAATTSEVSTAEAQDDEEVSR